MGRIKLSILTPEKVIFEGETDEIYMIMHDGERGFLPGHAPFVGTAGIGMMRLKNAGIINIYEIEGGLVEISGNRMILLAEEALKKEELSEKQLRMEISQLEEQLRSAKPAEKKRIMIRLKKLTSRLATALYN
jgi:F-type H+-transporting ATPase subunit epsilon